MWWATARCLLQQKARISSIPALKVGKKWVLDTGEKADAFVDTFTAKNKMIDKEDNQFTELFDQRDALQVIGAPDMEAVLKVLSALDEDSATGPDLLPSRILKFGAGQLARPIHQLVLVILRDGKWPKSWMVHWICPLHKKNPSTTRETTEVCT